MVDDAAKRIIETFAEIDDAIHAARVGADGKATDAALHHAIQALHGLRDKVVEIAIKLDNVEAAGD
jgi:hypothetical protein